MNSRPAEKRHRVENRLCTDFVPNNHPFRFPASVLPACFNAVLSKFESTCRNAKWNFMYIGLIVFIH